MGEEIKDEVFCDGDGLWVREPLGNCRSFDIHDYEAMASALTALQAKVEELEKERDEARRSATLIATDVGARRAAAKKLLQDICACSAETDPASLDLPHVVRDCIEPLETLIAERDACLFLSQQTRRHLGQDGPMVLDAIGEKAAAISRAEAAEARALNAEALVKEMAEELGDLHDMVLELHDYIAEETRTPSRIRVASDCLNRISALLSKAEAMVGGEQNSPSQESSALPTASPPVETAAQHSDGWRDIANAPKDGTVIDLTAISNDGEVFEVWPMRWAHIQRNGLFPGKVGMWTHPSGHFTWNDEGLGGPTHWRPRSRALGSERSDDQSLPGMDPNPPTHPHATGGKGER
jgi:hypothetical protein